MTDYNSKFVKFTYTILNPNGLPQSKSWIINLNFVISVEATAANDLRIILSNNQIISIDLGREVDASEIMNEFLSMSAEGKNYSVYKIDSFERK